MASNQQQLLSKMATSSGHGENSPYQEGWKAYESDRYDPTINPDGVIEMDETENKLCLDLVQEWMKNNPKASIFTAEGINKFQDIAMFDDIRGLPDFRKAVAKFMGKVRGNRVAFDPDRIVMSGGQSGAHETIASCLAKDGGAFLVPTPHHLGSYPGLSWRTKVQIVRVVCESSNDFKITREALEAAYKKAQEDNISVKGILITNPSNPLGTFLDRETLRDLVGFINEKNIHLVCDEIYAAAVFTGQPNFISVSEIIEEIECKRDLIHIVSGPSKDMGLPGFGAGIIYSYNDKVVNGGREMSRFGSVPSETQHLYASMLSDDDFVERFLAESAKRLAARYEVFTRGLAKVGIGYLKSNTGLFLWLDLHHLLAEQTFEEEIKLWRQIINDAKLNVSPGSSLHCKNPGWFRVSIANMDGQTMQVAFSRISTFIPNYMTALMPKTG